jgi:hypothetical protein
LILKIPEGQNIKKDKRETMKGGNRRRKEEDKKKMEQDTRE